MVKEVYGTAFIFNVPKSIEAGLVRGDDQLDLCKGYDHSWVLRNNKSIEHVAQLNEPISGRVLNLYTDQPALHVYSANFIEGIGPNKKGEFYKNQTGLCLETQHSADSPNQKHFPDTILKPNEEYINLKHGFNLVPYNYDDKKTNSNKAASKLARKD